MERIFIQQISHLRLTAARVTYSREARKRKRQGEGRGTVLDVVTRAISFVTFCAEKRAKSVASRKFVVIYGYNSVRIVVM